jgi:phosphate transport system substrate-binding protein
VKHFNLAIAAGVLTLLSATTAGAVDITGAGSTFAAPLYASWGDAAKAKFGIALNYQAIGSGGGITQITNRTVDFGATDAPVPHDQLMMAKMFQFPTAIGAEVATYNIAGVTDLTLSGQVLADIYLGKITKWNDAAIAKLNPGKTLPSTAIVPVYRSDASGTTFAFTSYLATVSPDWKSGVGAATSVQWPAGTGSKGNDGVAATVKNTPGGVGYVEFIYAASNNLPAAAMVNKAGKTVKPSTAGFSAAASQADWAHAVDMAPTMLDLGGDTTWPIVTATYALLPTNPTDAAKSAAVMKFFDFGYSADGQALAQKLFYISIPDTIAAEIRKAWRAEVKGPDGKTVSLE